MTSERLAARRRGRRQARQPDLNEWLDDLQNERDALIMRLRHIDPILVKHERLQHETLPRRVR